MEEIKLYHWADKIAQQIIERSPNKEEYVCAAGISPSGSVHIGNFRDVATSLFVVKALQKCGKKARLLFSWDELDRLRKVPKNVAEITTNFEKNIGKAYVDIENPFKENSDSKNYAEYFEKEFEKSIQPFNIDLDFRYQAQMYRSGKYVEHILFALEKRKEIFDILDRHRTQDSSEGERESYYPVSIYCPKCGRDTTKIHKLSDDKKVATFECKCGYSGDFDFTKDFNCKLSWKVDWAMRWKYEKIDFEPGGIDHASPHGSYDTSKDISKEIFDYQPPLFQGYGFIGIRGSAGKMSGSSGLNLTPTTLLKIYQPEVLLWLYAKTEPNREFDFCFDDGILRQYFEFDKMLGEVKENSASDLSKAIMSFVEIKNRKIYPVPFNLLVQLGSVVDFNVNLLQIVLSKIEYNYTENELSERLELAKRWLEECSPESVNHIRKCRNWEVFELFSSEEKAEIKLLFDYLTKNTYTLDDLQTKLYAIPREVRGIAREDKSLKKVQTQFFSNVYKLLIDKEKGPRLYLFLYAISPEKYIKLLDFSYPKTEEEQISETKIENNLNTEVVEIKEVINTKAIVEDFKPNISIDDFDKIDIRVCEVLKCTEIRKSHSCYKITLFDGKAERTIVSSIKNYYKPEQLIGKKILVLANLAPIRIAGVTSEGMLLAATFGDNCKVTFVDDAIPPGTIVR
jgi:lysyl-tRNA synthetase class 1